MSIIKTKAIFYAYSNNALDHLAPYAALCHKKKIECVVIFGEDFVKFKVSPNKNIIQIFKDLRIHTFNFPQLEKKGIIQFLFSYVWSFTNIIEKLNYIPNFFKNKMRGLCNKFFNNINVELIGINTAKKLLENTDKVLVFTDAWNQNKKIQNSFLSYVKGKATIISTNHYPWHFNREIKIPQKSFREDIAIVANSWEASAKNFIEQTEITGSLRYSKKWIEILDKYNYEKVSEKNSKKNVLALTHSRFHTRDWERMLELLRVLQRNEDINLSILPHIRGMINAEPPKDLEKVWDKKSNLVSAVKKADIVIFWTTSALFEAVLRNKKIFYLSFLSPLDGEYIWQKEAPTNIVIKNETELLDEINKYKKNDLVDNSCFEKIIWPSDDPWSNVSNFLNKILNLKI
jgi:hypothetical protein